MTYAAVAAMQASESLRRRLAACAATEGIADPDAWSYAHVWALVASPGWAEAWLSAMSSGVADPGADGTVVTDGMILSAVQQIEGSA